MNHKEVCHVWASQKKQSGKGSNIFFEGPSIFSYGRHFEIARFVRPDVVLFTNRGYSVSTSKHKSYTRNAIGSHIRVYEVPDFTYHPDNLRYFFEQARTHLINAGRARIHKDWHLELAQRAIENALAYTKDFASELKTLKPETAKDLRLAKSGKWFDPDKITAIQTAAKEAAKKQAEAEKIKQAKRIEKEKQDLIDWRNGGDSYRYFTETALRIKGDAVETSRGARVPVIEARKLYRAIKAGLDVRGQQIGHYTVLSLTADMLTVGCHHIPMTEVERISAEVLAWTAPSPTVCEHCLGIEQHEANCSGVTA